MEWLGLATSPDKLQLYIITPIRSGSALITIEHFMHHHILVLRSLGVLSCMLVGKMYFISCHHANWHLEDWGSKGFIRAQGLKARGLKASALKARELKKAREHKGKRAYRQEGPKARGLKGPKES